MTFVREILAKIRTSVLSWEELGIWRKNSSTTKMQTSVVSNIKHERQCLTTFPNIFIRALRRLGKKEARCTLINHLPFTVIRKTNFVTQWMIDLRAGSSKAGKP